MLPSIISGTLFTVFSLIFADCTIIVKAKNIEIEPTNPAPVTWVAEKLSSLWDRVSKPEHHSTLDSVQNPNINNEIEPTNPAPVTWVAEKLSSLWDRVSKPGHHSTLDSNQNPVTNSTLENIKLAVKVLDRGAGLNLRDFIRISFNVSGFSAEDFKVTIERDHIVVRGTHTYEGERLEVIRRINIPEGIDRNTIQCILDKQNEQLTILGKKAADGRAQRR
ncbi:hsp20/alpha crystallin family domain-containing protein [Ditylenchus destructor]|nr:hsp20/alpha crystallin family domain-containing protein [Ditylenchus destructor]